MAPALQLPDFRNPWVQLLALVLATLAVIAVVELAGLVPEGEKEPPPAKEGVGWQDMPDFTVFSTVPGRKANFFGYLRPIVKAENQRIRRRRERLRGLAERVRSGRELPPEERQWLADLARDYRLEPEGKGPSKLIAGLLRRVDVIPASLVLVQAAKESGWGTSRFAQQGNNLFGQWCFSTGCGIVPARREPGKSHEVERFPTVRASVRSYLRNLNTHRRYEELREIRARLREAEVALTGIALAEGLRAYAENGDQYVPEVRAMIRANNLEEKGG